MTTTTLTGSANPYTIAPGIRLEAPGITGRVKARGRSVSRSTGITSYSVSSPLDEVLLGAGMSQVYTFDMAIWPRPGTGTKRGGPPTSPGVPPPLLMRVLEPIANTGYVLLHIDELGVPRWLFPSTLGEQAPLPETGGKIVFELPREQARPLVPQPGTAGTKRGIITATGRREVRLITWATDEIIGQGCLAWAQRWERKHRPYGFLRFRPGEPARPEILDPQTVTALGTSPVLLLLHGTFSHAEETFLGLVNSPYYEALYKRYEQRIIAFNHPSLHQSPADNANYLLQQLPTGTRLKADLLTHSRGALVGRELVERNMERSRNGAWIDVARSLFVAGPHQGTLLADGDNWISFVDRYTMMLLALPDTFHTITLEGVLAAVKLLAHGALAGLPGLHSLTPKGDYLQRLNSSPPHSSQYYAIAADFTPKNGGLLAQLCSKVGEKLTDALFGEPNDMVVPARGSFEAGLDSPGFPIPTERRRLFDLESDIHHCNYFASDAVNHQIAEWLIPEA